MERFIAIGIKTFLDDRGIKATRDETGKLRNEVGRFAAEGKKGFDQMERSALSLRDRFSKIGDGLQTIGTRLSAGITAPLALLGAGAVKSARDMDSLNRGMVAVSGSAAKAKAEIANLREVAKLPGLGFKEAIQGSVNLQAAGLSADLARRSLGAFGNALATVGKGKAELEGVNTALSQIVSKGKVSAEEINQIAERVPQIRKVMLQAFGTADTEKLQKANISSLEFITRVVAELEKLPKVTGGAANSFENLADTAEQSLVPVGNAILRFIIPAIERVTPVIESLSDSFARLSPESQNFIIGAAGIAAAIGPATLALGTFISSATTVAGLFAAEGALTIGVSGFGAAVAATFAAAGPVGIAIVGATALAGALYLLSQRTAEVQSATLGEIQARAQQSQSLEASSSLLKGLGDAVLVTREEQAKLKEAYDALNPAAQERIRLLTDERDVAAALADELKKLRDQSKAELTFEGAKAVAEFETLRTQIQITTDAIRQNEEAFKDAFRANDARALSGLSESLKLNRQDLVQLNEQFDVTKAKIRSITETTGLNVRDLAIEAQVKGLVKSYQSVATALESTIPAAKTAATNLGKGTTGALKDAVRVSEIFKVGTDVGAGLAAGINSPESQAKVKAAAANLGKIADQATSSQLERKSPSRVFMRIGNDITEGLILGIKSKASEVKKVLKELMKEATETAKEIVQLSNPKIFSAKNRNADLQDRNKLQDEVFELARKAKGLVGAPFLDRLPTDQKRLESLKAQFEAAIALNEFLKQSLDDTAVVALSVASSFQSLEEAGIPVPGVIRQMNEELGKSVDAQAKAVASYEQIKQGLQGIVDSADKATQAQKLARQIASLPMDFPAWKRAELEGLANQARGVELRSEDEKRQLEQQQRAQATAQKIGDLFTAAFRDSFEKGIKGFWDRILVSAKEAVARAGANILSNLVTGLFSRTGNTSSGGNGSSSGGGFNPLSILQQLGGGGNAGGGGFSIPGLGPGGTAGFNGNAGLGLGNSGPISLLNKIPVVNKLFSGGGVLGKIGSFLGLGGGAAAGTGALTGGSIAAGIASSPALGLAGAGAATGGLLGGTITGGAAAGGGGLLASIGALATNPITIGIAAAIGGGLLLYKLFSGRDLKEYRKLINGEYKVDVKDNNVLKQIKQIGQEQFGKEWKRKKLETIRLEPSKQIISSYAEATGQGNNNLALERRKLDPNDPINRYEIPIQRREFGGRVWPGEDFLVGERRAEVVRFDRPATIYPSVEAYQQGNGRSTGNANVPIGLWQAILAELAALRAQMQPVNGDEFFMAKLKRNSEEVARTANAGQRGSGYALGTLGDAGY